MVVPCLSRVYTPLVIERSLLLLLYIAELRQGHAGSRHRPSTLVDSSMALSAETRSRPPYALRPVYVKLVYRDLVTGLHFVRDWIDLVQLLAGVAEISILDKSSASFTSGPAAFDDTRAWARWLSRRPVRAARLPWPVGLYRLRVSDASLEQANQNATVKSLCDNHGESFAVAA